MPRARHAGMAAAALALLAAEPAAAGEAFVPTTRPQVEHTRALLVRGGPQAGRVLLTVRVRYAMPLPRRVWLLPDAAAATHVGRVALTVSDAGRTLATVRDANPLVLTSPRRKFSFVHRIVLGRADSARIAAAGRVRVGVSARAEVNVDGRGRPDAYRSSRRALAVSVARVARAPRATAPVCEARPFRAHYASLSRTALVCMGEGVAMRLARRPARGRARVLSARGGRAVVAYRAPARFVGSVGASLRAANSGGAVVAPLPIEVQPFKLRAIGDSVTAGFGYLGDGTPWGALSLPECIPPGPPNDRCSSNSPNGIGSDGPVGWSPDFGLGNNVAWPAQFANRFGITGTGMFENWAVSGSTPADWDTGGYLNDTLEEIVAGGPDLTVLTLGANPLLDTFLFGKGLECAVSLTDQELRACVQSFIDQNRLVPRLQSVLGQLLAAPGNTVVVSQYHLAIPSTALFSVSQLRIIFNVVNLNVRQAARAVDGFGTRLLLMAPPPFNVGLGPGSVPCPGSPEDLVDGPSRQARVSQDELLAAHPFTFCDTDEYWVISADTGIHPSRLGHAQFAAALGDVALANGLVPALP